MKAAKRQQGAYLVLMAFIMVMLIGLGALVLDLGRLFLLKSEMQNAVDAAALAAARELNKQDDAQAKAKAAARSFLTHEATFVNQYHDLLNDDSLPDGAFTFYCSIGYKYELGEGPDYCAGADTDPDDDNKIYALDDSNARYVRVDLSPDLAADHFEMDFLFLPVLRIFGIETALKDALSVYAIAGNTFIACTVPPLAICNPFENPDDPTNELYAFKNNMPAGGHIEIKVGGGSTWTPGNFGLLLPPESIQEKMVDKYECAKNTENNGAQLVGCFLAAELEKGCAPPTFETKPGSNNGPAHGGIATRFDDYTTFPFAPWISTTVKSEEYPPDVNINEFKFVDVDDVDGDGDVTEEILYLDNQTLESVYGDPKFAPFGAGTGWDRDDYWAKKHPGIPAPWPDTLSADASRYDVYEYELSHSQELAPSHAPSVNRRIVNVAVLQCQTLDLNGKEFGTTLFEGGGFAQIFLLAKPPHGGGSDIFISAEYLGWEKLGDAGNETVIQLYE